jgi:peptidoglycan hydrolase-like protein with peptidoglycan-binding domain
MKTLIKSLLVSAAVCGLFAVAPGKAASAGEYAVKTYSTTQTQLSRADVTEIQGKLAELSFYDGLPDGSWGPRTTMAVRNFQSSRDMKPTGMPTAETLNALDVTPARSERTNTLSPVAEIEPKGGGAVYQENVVQSAAYTTRGGSGVLSVENLHVNGSTCLTCTNGIYGTGNTENMRSNEY